MNLLKNAKVTRVLVAQADGTGTQSSDILDMAGFDGVLFIAKFDDVDDTSVLTLRAQENTANSTSGMATLTQDAATFTAGATNADNNLLILDVYRPRERYIRAQVVIATANATTACILAIQYGGHKAPITQGSTVVDTAICISSAE